LERTQGCVDHDSFRGNTVTFYPSKGLASVIGFIVAPLAAAIVLTTYTLVMDGTAIGSSPFSMALIYYSACAVVALVVGLPMFVVLLRFRRIQAWTTMLAGAVIGGSVALAIGFDMLRPVGVLAMAASGTAAALVFWLVWQSSGPSARRTGA
jgi:hypothetical protein